MSKFRASFPCPYCGHENHLSVSEYGEFMPRVIACDNDSGGCDSWFAVTATVEVIVTPTVRKIDGCEPPAEKVADIRAWREGRGDAEAVGGAA
jgi:hypothetical protein